ncbi:MAG: hypothetical protein ACSHWW_06095 [Nonlabens sp.]|uniref:hypothetical protein n=1 Tax=Nonlabens sp. TaxID=1888209 RepID=UPI003EF48C86
MKPLIIFIVILSFISCKPKSEISEKTITTEPYMWTVVISNGIQENASDMTQTRYIFLTNSDDKDSLCNGSSLISETAYKEFSRNDHTIEKPVWSTRDKDVTTIKARQILDIACGNEDAIYGISSLTKFPHHLTEYPIFKEAIK